jgi:hypothetical protein
MNYLYSQPCFMLSQCSFPSILYSRPFVAMDTTEPYFVRLPTIILSEVVTFMKGVVNSQSSDWKEILDRVLEKEHNQAFKISEDKHLPF